MQAVVLAAGEGRRMRPLSAAVPKPMLPVGDRPLAAHAMGAAVGAGVEELVLVVGDEADAFREQFGDRFAGVPLRYADQPAPDGTADAVRAARDRIDGPFLVLNGDNLYRRADLERLVEACPGVGAARVENPSNYGVLTTDDGRVARVIEKPDEPPNDLVNAGAYAFPAAAADRLEVPPSERDERELTDVLARVVDDHAVTPVELERWMDVGRPWELLEANERALGRLEPDVAGEVSPDAGIEGDVVVEPGATIESGVEIEGPVLVRSGATVGPEASVRGATLVGPDARVGRDVEVENSVLMAGTTLARLSYVGDSVVGPGATFGAGTRVAHRRGDGAPVRATVAGQRVSTGRRRFGAVVGEDVEIGPKTRLDPGVTLSPGARTDPGEMVTRDR